MLIIVPTPIGNLGDITKRALTALAECDFIIAENPNQTHKLLNLLNLSKKEIVQFADHNEIKVLDKITSRLISEKATLVTDAGTPSISDPGFRLIRECRNRKIEVISLPGASAVTTALAGSGLPTDKFIFVGFLPKTEPKLVKAVDESKKLNATLIAYESPQRIIKSVGFINDNFPDAKVVIARELTKLHEEYLTGTPQEILNLLKNKPSIKGEITLIVAFK